MSTPREGRRRSIRAGETGSLADTSGGIALGPACRSGAFHAVEGALTPVCAKKTLAVRAHAYPGQTRTRSKLLSQRRCARHAATAKTRGEGSGRDAQTYESQRTSSTRPQSQDEHSLVCESDPGRSRGETTCAPTTPQSRQARPMNLMLQEYIFALQQSSP